MPCAGGGDTGAGDDMEVDGWTPGLVETANLGEREPDTYRGGFSSLN